MPDDGFAVVALANARGGVDVPDEIVCDALGLFVAEKRQAVTLTTPWAEWPEYAGTYDDGLGTLGAGDGGARYFVTRRGVGVRE